jgi:hypothetical protein
MADLLSRARDASPLAQICARVDYVNGLQENLKGQEAASDEVRAEFRALVEQCRTALRDYAEENDWASGRDACDLCPWPRGGRDSVFPGTYALWTIRAGHSVKNF